jgi:pyrophosphate--fructose-6-phosphate 1-phosphotransferase
VLATNEPLGVVAGARPGAMADELFVSSQLHYTYGQQRLEIVPAGFPEARLIAFSGANGKPLKIGLVFCGRQCPGAHNVAAGLVDLLAQRGGGQVYGFVNGTRGLFSGQAKPLTPEGVAPFLNCGGMALLGRSADVIRTPEQFAQAEASCAKLELDGLVLLGGPVTNSDTALLAEHFAKRKAGTKVIGVPATIDGDLYSHTVEASIGFDTACKVITGYLFTPTHESTIL